MQEVSGSSPLSSTGQKRNSNDSNSEYSRKVQQRRPGGPPYVCSDRASSPSWAVGRTPASDAGQPVTWANTRLIGPVTLPPGHHPALQEGHSCQRLLPRLQVTPAALGVPAGPIRSQEPRPLGRAARPLTVGSARRWCQWPAGALRRSGAGLRRGAARRVCRCAGAPHEEPGREAAQQTWPGAGR
jgi:hypothetical protein